MARIKTFDDWVEILRMWQKDIDVDPEIFERILGGYKLEAKYGDLHSDEIEFGEFAGGRKWDKVMEIPDQRMRDAVLNMIIYQGDTEFASNEQQRKLLGAFDPFSRDLQTQPLTQTDDSARDSRRARAGVDAGDQAAVQLDAGQRQPLK